VTGTRPTDYNKFGSRHVFDRKLLLMKTGIISTKKTVFQIILYGFGICFLILINGFFVPNSTEHIQQAYPPPSTTQPYPPPGMIINTTIYIDTVDASSPQLLNPKDGHVLS
jgi:hypothetical protein